MNNIQKASDQGAQNLQKLLADKSSRDQRDEQQGIQNVDLLKNCVFSSILPIKLDILGAYFASIEKVMPSLLQSTNFYGALSLHSKKKPTSFLLSLFGAVIDIDWVVEKLAHAQNEPDKYGHDYNSYQEAVHNSKQIGQESHEKYEQSQNEIRQNQHQSSSSSDSGGTQRGSNEIDKFSEGHRRAQHQNHENHNHNNHYNAVNNWKMNSQILEDIKRKYDIYMQGVNKEIRDSNEALQKENRIAQAKRRR
jgi:hypothetical protein